MALNGIFSLCNPVAIARLVIFGVIDSAYYVLGSRTWPHIFKKCLELFPTPADLDAYITFILAIRPFASSVHIAPADIGRRSAQSMGFWTIVTNTASAALAKPTCQVLRHYSSRISARTLTQPVRFLLPCSFGWRLGDDCELTKCLAPEVDEMHV